MIRNPDTLKIYPPLLNTDALIWLAVKWVSRVVPCAGTMG